MARRRKPGRKQKSGPRTKSGRLSRAYKTPEIRDHGTKECQDKRQYLINGADPQLAATASGILLANGCLTQEQHTAALRYAWAHALVYGKPWRQICPLGDPVGSEPPQRMQEIARDKLAWMDRAARPRAAQGGRRRRGVRLPADVVDRRQAQAARHAGRRERPPGAAQRARRVGRVTCRGASSSRRARATAWAAAPRNRSTSAHTSRQCPRAA